MKLKELCCLKIPEKTCYRKVITTEYEEKQACLRSFEKVCEEEC